MKPMRTPMTKPIRILIIDDQEIFRTALRLLLERQPGLTVIGEAANRTDALAVVVHEQPDIILLDLDLRCENGLDFLPELIETANGGRVLILTGMCDPEVYHRAMCLGAMGLVSKDKPAEILIKAIEKVYAGEVWLDRAMMASVLGVMSRSSKAKPTDPEAAKIATLTGREREIITLIGAGLKNKQIADRLFISETTVSHHLTSIFDKLGIQDRLELVIYAYRHGLVKLSP